MDDGNRTGCKFDVVQKLDLRIDPGNNDNDMNRLVSSLRTYVSGTARTPQRCHRTDMVSQEGQVVPVERGAKDATRWGSMFRRERSCVAIWRCCPSLLEQLVLSTFGGLGVTPGASGCLDHAPSRDSQEFEKRSL